MRDHEETYMYQFSSVTQSCATLGDPMDCSTPGLPVHQQLPEFSQTHVRWVGDTIQPSHPMSLPSLPTFNLSQHQGLIKRVSSSYQVAGIVVSASTSVLLMNIQDWCPLRWTAWISSKSKWLSRVFSNSSKAAILWCSAFFIVQLSHPYMTPGKTIALTRQNFSGRVTLLLCNMLSRLVITFLPRSKSLLISWLQSPSAVILEPSKITVTVSTVSHLFERKWWNQVPWY